MATLFDEASSDEEGNLKINSNYAEKYNHWREKEEYQKCQSTSLNFYVLIYLIKFKICSER